MSDPEPFYRPLDGPGGSRFHATAATTGPWFADAQHGGPPSALLVRALERCAEGPGADGTAATRRFARVTFEILGPVPAGDVEVSARVARPGRAVELVEAEMVAGGRPVLLARGWRFATRDTAHAATGAAVPPPGPETGTPVTTLPEGWVPGFMDAIDWRLHGGGFAEPGPALAWIRQRGPLVEGEQPSGLQRLALAADCANGVAAALDVRSWLFLNTELTVHAHREPVGEWCGVDAATVIGPDGTGTVSAQLFDEAGHVGRAAQALTVRPRGGTGPRPP